VNSQVETQACYILGSFEVKAMQMYKWW